jgi:mannose/fructose/N-acetylgalactosamine-specific phosphotransferase system component IIB
MTDKDREWTEKMLDKAVAQQSELIKLQFVNFWDKLDAIHDEVKKTNGTVREHTKTIQELKEAETKHIINCPQKKDMDSLKEKLVNIEKIEVGREAVSKFSWKQVTGLGIVAGIVFGLFRILLDLLKTII